MKPEVIQQLKNAAPQPGVYLMRDVDGDVIYVGKAGRLRKRLAAYLRPVRQLDPKTRVLVSNVHRVETIITGSEKEALLLESTLIKRHRPRYNVILKDDKRYPSLRIDRRKPFPRLRIVRRIQKDGAVYFGPFSSAGAVRQVLKMVDKTFKLRKCSRREFSSRTRPCLHFQMQQCLAPCCREVSTQAYDQIVEEVILFLKGRTPQLIRRLRKQMQAASDALAYEKAAVIRDRIFALEKTLEKQVAVTTDFGDRDVFAAALSSQACLVTMLVIRGGFLQGTRHFVFQSALPTEEELLAASVLQYYEKAPFIPPEVLLSGEIQEAVLLEERLRQLGARRVVLHVPRRGEKARLVKMALENAAGRLAQIEADMAANRDLLERLQRRLKLPQLPRRIECFDNSSMGGEDAVSAVVVFQDGRPRRSRYRRYRMQSPGPDDYRHMAEVLRRRYAGKGDHPLPDLLMVDGGRGQLNVAVKVLGEIHPARLPAIIAIAKKDPRRGLGEDRIFQPGRANPVNFGKDRDLQLFLQQIRDEAHRTAIAFHRRRHRRSSLHSALDEVPGIGPKRKHLLLSHFGSIEKIRAASLEELSGLPGMNRLAAQRVKEALS